MMATQPTADEVKAIIDTDLPDVVIDAIIDDAELIVAPCLGSLSDAAATSVIKWTAAHMIYETGNNASSTGIVTSDKLGDASTTYSRSANGEGIAGSAYGRMAISLAPCVARLGKAKATIEIL